VGVHGGGGRPRQGYGGGGRFCCGRRGRLPGAGLSSGERVRRKTRLAGEKVGTLFCGCCWWFGG
jgi:hypothetical protein